VSLQHLVQRAIGSVRFEKRWFFLIYFLTGLPYLILTGPFRAPDERNHFLRAYEISEGRFNRARVAGPVTGDDLPSSLTRLSDVLGNHSDNHIAKEQIEAARALRLMPQERAFIEFSTAVYSPITYMPAALAAAFGRLLGAGPLALVFFARCANLIVGGALITLALSYAGYARRTLLLIAILPMTVSQIATVTADAISYGLSFLWVALVMDTAVKSSGEASWKRPLSLMALALCLSQLRPPCPLLALLIFLVPMTTLGKKTILLWLAVVLASILPAIAWNAAAAPLFQQAPVGETVNPSQQARWVAKHPGIFWHRAKQDLKRRGAEYWEQFVGRLGWLNIFLPFWIPIGFVLALAFGTFVGPTGPPSPLWWQRLALGTMAFGGIFAIQLTLYLTFNGVNSPFILGVQGRYFTPLAVLAAFAFSNSWLTRPAVEPVFKFGCLLLGFSAHCGALFAVARAAGRI
jgi:uncharacterized membrane protein